jgi:hypothetical protein
MASASQEADCALKELAALYGDGNVMTTASFDRRSMV